MVSGTGKGGFNKDVIALAKLKFLSPMNGRLDFIVKENIFLGNLKAKF